MQVIEGNMLSTVPPARSHDGGQPYALPTRKERSRELAQKRRTTYKSLMNDMSDVLPFSKEVVSQVDYNSRLRLALCYIRMKKLLGADPDEEEEDEVKKSIKQKRGLFQDLMVETLDGFLMTCLGDGAIIHISETIHKHLGLFQSEHIGHSLYDLIHEDDHNEAKRSLTQAESRILARQGTVQCSFFCRMKCSKSKLSNSAAKSPGFKLVYISGQYKSEDNDSFLAAVIHPVSPPSILEVRMEGNMFVTHYTLDMRCTFFDGRLKMLMGFDKQDLVGHVPFQYHHHEDVAATLECSKGLMERGEGLSGYYRYINKYGVHVWVQSRGIMMFDGRTGKPSYIVCMNYVISKESGEKELELRNAITSGQNQSNSIIESTHSYDPFPTSREDALSVNPFKQTQDILEVPKIKNEEFNNLSVPSVSPSESCRTSTDLIIAESISNTIMDNKDVPSDSEDMGYSSSVSHSNYGSIVSPQSITSSLSNDDTGSYYNNTFYESPCPRQSPDLPKETVLTTSNSQNQNLLATILTSRTTHFQATNPSQPMMLPSLPNYQDINQVYSVQPAMPYQQSVQVPLGMGPLGYQFRGGLQLIRPMVEFSATVLPDQYVPNNLPILTVEDVQLLTTNKQRNKDQ